MTDIVERLNDRAVCSIAHNSCRNDYKMVEAADEIERLREALRKTMHHLYDIGCFDHADEARAALEEKE